MANGVDSEAPARGSDPNDDRPRYPGEDVPVVDWEIPKFRKLIPVDLQVIIGVATPVVRVSASIDQKQRRRHKEDLDWYENLTGELQRWELVRQQPAEEAAGSKEQRWQVVLYFDEETQRIPLLIILELRNDGVLYLRSIHRRQSHWGLSFAERLGVVRRRDEG